MNMMNLRLLIIVFFLGFYSSNTQAQVLAKEKSQSTQELYDFHISKHKENKTSAWITLGGGLAMIVGGLAINMSQPMLGSSDDNNKGLWLSYLGGATTLASIPLFISASKHKNTAKIQLQNGAVGYHTKYNYSGISILFSL